MEENGKTHVLSVALAWRKHSVNRDSRCHHSRLLSFEAQKMSSIALASGPSVVRCWAVRLVELPFFLCAFADEAQN